MYIYTVLLLLLPLLHTFTQTDNQQFSNLLKDMKELCRNRGAILRLVDERCAKTYLPVKLVFNKSALFSVS